eukprot:SAG22_NODE_86_length_21440_cov_288.248700_1_plen_96_part_00
MMRENAFLTAGRLSVTVATASLTSYAICEKSIQCHWCVGEGGGGGGCRRLPSERLVARAAVARTPRALARRGAGAARQCGHCRHRGADKPHFGSK